MNGSTAFPRWAVALALGGTVAAGVYGFVVSRSRASGIDELRNEVVALRVAQRASPVVRELRTVVRERTVSDEMDGQGSVEAGERPRETEAAPELTPEEVQHRTEVIVAARERALEDFYGRESPDPQWSGAATSALRTAYSGEGFDALDIESECRATLCRVSFRYTDPAGELQWRNFMQRMPWPGATNANLDSEGRKGTFYLTRQGFELPRVDDSSLKF